MVRIQKNLTFPFLKNKTIRFKNCVAMLILDLYKKMGFSNYVYLENYSYLHMQVIIHISISFKYYFLLLYQNKGKDIQRIK